ncbi:GYD domain-containing protein [Thermodesulfobacteriota bacterium]
MSAFMMFGKYTTEAIKGISAERTEKAVDLIKKQGGEVISMYAVVGEHDLVFTMNLPDVEKALATSVALKELTGISFTTSPVIEIEKFDKLMAEVKNI